MQRYFSFRYIYFTYGNRQVNSHIVILKTLIWSKPVVNYNFQG